LVDLETRPPDSGIEEKPLERSRGRPRRGLWVFLGIVVGFVIYAYGFDVVKVNLDRVGEPVPQQRFFNVIRALGQPDLLTYETVETAVDVEFAMPCPDGGFTPAPPDGEATISVNPACAGPRDTVIVSGQGFGGNEPINIVFVPSNGIELRVAQTRTAEDGTFSIEAVLPNRPDDEIQTIRAKSQRNVGSVFDPAHVLSDDIDQETAQQVEGFLADGVIDSMELAQLPQESILREPEGPVSSAVEDGQLTVAELREAGLQVRSPRWSQNAEATWQGIIETIFLALLATTVGTLVAIPLSFLAARNLMSDVRIPALNAGLAVVALPIGAALGYGASSIGTALVNLLPGSALVLGLIVIALVWLGFIALRLAVPLPGTERSRLAKLMSGLGATAAFLLAAQGTVRFMEIGGDQAASALGSLAFLGTFVQRSGEILALVFGVLSAIAGAVALAILASKLSYGLSKRVGHRMEVVLSVIAVSLAGAIIAIGVGQVIGWIYQMTDATTTTLIPAIVGAILGLALGAFGVARGQLGAGLGVYYVFRTFFNALRSIEALILALIFVIWVGLGAFAGTLALALHTIAANGKLYSEQVESISSGPLEAIRATGATRLQTVVYAVVPQIVAPFIAFTMYRWDINVRMSTIIGFVGGGGIGLILQQNINLLNYRGAAAQMLAIAIVVAAMDWLSSRLREQFV
jgi:phosphonate ABC transporter permease subunit PhnE